jgi:hypothetical protein
MHFYMTLTMIKLNINNNWFKPNCGATNKYETKQFLKWEQEEFENGFRLQKETKLIQMQALLNQIINEFS